MNTYVAKRGATIVVPLEAVGAADADLAIVTLVDAGLKRAPYAPAVPGADEPRVATLEVAPRPAAGGVGPGWTFTLADEQSAVLEPGTYAMDAELHLEGGAIVITEPLFIRIEQAVSA